MSESLESDYAKRLSVVEDRYGALTAHASPTLNVPMTLEETGMLCHMITEQIMEARRRIHDLSARAARRRGSGRHQDEPEPDIFEDPDLARKELYFWTLLQARLAAANDVLMGKTGNDDHAVMPIYHGRGDDNDASRSEILSRTPSRA